MGYEQGRGSARSVEKRRCAPGKLIAGKVYAHRDLLPYLEDDLRSLAELAHPLVPEASVQQANVVRIDRENREVAFLLYPEFFATAFPSLHKSWNVRLDTGQVVHRTYAESLNPPILHRKELLLPEDHPARPALLALTGAAERAGLFEDPSRIGLKQQWENLLLRSGLTVIGHDLLPLANDLETGSLAAENNKAPIARHLTALSRSYLSVPVQSVIRHGLLKPSASLFDYGCGKGDDVRNLQSLGFSAAGWDPHYCSNNPQVQADIVNLGFVINVIEDLDERCAAVEKAFALADRLLVVGALIGEQPASGVRRQGDGVVTSRNTFQKYYSSGELLQFVSAVLDQDVLPAAPGVVYAFKDRALETNYLIGRYSTGGRVARALLPVIARSTEPRIRAKRPRREVPAEVAAALSQLWQLYMELGRRPELGDILDLDTLLGHFRTPGRVFRYVEGTNDAKPLQRSTEARRNDILVGLALQLFARRRRFRDLDDRLRLDIKAFFGSYENAQREALALLHGIGNTQSLLEQRDKAAAAGLGYVDHEGHLQLHSSLVGQLPPLLRAYAGAASAAYGDLASTDLVKLHVGTGKVTLMAFDDFVESPLPRMTQRVKVNLRDQDLQVFEYGSGFTPPHLYWKSRYINEEFPNYIAQQEFDEQLASLAILGTTAYGPNPEELAMSLEARRWAIEGLTLVRSRRIPDLDDKCGRFLTYRQLIECGETWESERIDNRPVSPDSYTALYELAINVLDPVIDYFGMIKLTYGFCSAQLARRIKKRISPKLDQHSAHECNSRGSRICDRLGAAVEFFVEFEDTRDVATWVTENTPFDRLYFYGSDRPVHVSYGPEGSRSIVDMSTKAGQIRVPRRVPQLTP